LQAKGGDPRVQFDAFDSSHEDRRDEKVIYKYIQRMDYRLLE